MSRFLPQRISFLALSTALVLSAGPTVLHASTWAGTTAANWSSNANPGWNGTGVPNAAGAQALYPAVNGTTNVDGNYTVGVIRLSGAAPGTRAITAGGAGTSLTLDNAGATVLLENTSTSTAGVLSFGGTGDGLILNGNVAINNTNTNASLGTQSVSFSTGTGAVLSGTGNVAINNAVNLVTGVNGVATSRAVITISATNTFVGTTAIQSGAVSFTNSTGSGTATPFGPSTNAVTLGNSGSGSATLVSTAAITLANPITVASGSGGTLILGSNSASTTANSTFSGAITLNGNVTLSSIKGVGADVRYTGVISGAGGVTVIGTGLTRFGSGGILTNTYAGNTVLTSTSSLTLSANTALTFYIGASGVNNGISATGGNNNTLTLDGKFAFDLSGAASTGSWNIVDTASLNETYTANFGVTGFTQSGTVFTGTFGSTTYSFDETTGLLTAVPEPSTYLLLGLGGFVILFGRRLKNRFNLASR